ncbi:MAG: D-alanyl-D-alanine carboxypeptidase/D-alanyl-D-alanine-endopeptidase [Melioribacteraceae bacterium]|nr:D-alanyl-D-alanine carboxypeptidase/D-alanyl-D-alanine-endopeptidase [Melioribacteraceae bacterium]
MRTILLYLILLTKLLFSQNNVSTQISELLDSDFFESSQIGVSVYNLTKEKSLFSQNENMLFHPASNMKILTSAAGLKYLGADYHFTTKVCYTGVIEDSTLTGNIYIVGGCDPDFTSSDLDSLVKGIVNYGIKEVSGNVYGDVSMLDSLFWGKGWMWDDDPSTDFPYLTPLTINDNAVKIIYSPGKIKKPLHVITDPDTDYFNIKNNSLTFVKDSTKLKVTRDWINRNNDLLIDGFLPYINYPDTVRVNLYQPEKYFMHLLKKSFTENNINVSGNFEIRNIKSETENIFTFERSYKDVIVNLNKASDNLSAEMTLRALGNKYFGNHVSANDALRLIDSLIICSSDKKQIYRVVDGSGVSHYNLVTADILLNVLKYFYYNEKENYQILKNSFPIGGIDGTLKYRMIGTKAENNVYAKTGTLSGVSCLSGYLTSDNGDEIAFSIMIQNFVGSSKTARDYHDKICEILCNIN